MAQRNGMCWGSSGALCPASKKEPWSLERACPSSSPVFSPCRWGPPSLSFCVFWERSLNQDSDTNSQPLSFHPCPLSFNRLAAEGMTDPWGRRAGDPAPDGAEALALSGLHAAHTLSLAYRCSGRQRRKWTCSVWVPGPSAPVSSHQSSRCPSGPREEGGTRGTGAWAGSRAQGLLGWPQSLRGPEPEAASLGAYSVPRALKSHPQEPRGRQENASGMAVDWFCWFPSRGPTAASRENEHGSRWKPWQIALGHTLRPVPKIGCLATIVSQGEKIESGVPDGGRPLTTEPPGLLGRRWYLHVAHYRCFVPHWVSGPLCLRLGRD